MPDERLVKVIWAAGFLDGEGTFTISGAKNSRFVAIMAAQVDLRPLNVLRDLWGGSITERPPDSRHPNNRKQYVWVISTRKVIVCLNEIVTYLVLKGDQARLLLEYSDTIGLPGFRVNKSMLPIRGLISDKIYLLNKRGI